MSEQSDFTIGSTVKLFGLSSAQYNGLTGTILSGPNDKGRYEVDLVVVNDHALEEHKFVSFKPDNMRVIAVEVKEEPESPSKIPRCDPGISPDTFLPSGPVLEVKPKAKAKAEGGSYRSGGADTGGSYRNAAK